MHIEPRLQWHKYNNNYIYLKKNERIYLVNNAIYIPFFFKKKVLYNIEKQLEFEGLRDYLSHLFQFHAVIFFIIGFFPFFTKKKKSKQDISQSVSRNMQRPLEKWMKHSSREDSKPL